MSKPQVDILLPVWNGEGFLSEQIASLLRQEQVSVTIRARDDGSDDASLSLLRQWQSRSGRLDVYCGERRGVVGNIDRLLHISAEAGSAYFALCDQDDLWYPHKVHRCLQAMHALEQQYGDNVPLLVFSDARCVDSRGGVLAPSFLRHLGIPEGWGGQLQQALILSPALGCSCLGNAALRRMALPIPAAETIFMHDWWLLLVAVAFGHSRCVLEPLLDYRQHDRNLLGARGGRRSFLQRLTVSRNNAARTQKQARTFLNRFSAQLSGQQRALIAAWADMPQAPYLLRRWKCWRSGFCKPGLSALLT